MNTRVCLLSWMASIAGGCIAWIPSSVKAQPANDLFAQRTVMTGTNSVVTGTSVGASREAGEPPHAGNNGGASVWWSWTAPFSGFVTITTSGSGFDTVLGVYTGTAVSALTWVAGNDDENYGGGIYTSKVFIDVVAGQTYQIAVDGYGGESGYVRLQTQLVPFPVAPAWTLPDPYGMTVHSSDFAGKVIILDFWATWCGPCKAEIPDYVFLQDKYGADGLVIVGPSVDSTAQVVITFTATNNPPLNYPLVMANSAIRQAYGGVSAIPTTFIIDRQNIIRKKYVGTQPRSTFERAIIPLLYGDTRLDCRRVGSQLVLSWPAGTALPFTLESATAPVGGSWLPWPVNPLVVNGTNTVQVPLTGAPRYFRIRAPY